MIKKLYTKLMRFYCLHVIKSHYFVPVTWLENYHVRKEILCTRCKLNIKELRDD